MVRSGRRARPEEELRGIDSVDRTVAWHPVPLPHHGCQRRQPVDSGEDLVGDDACLHLASLVWFASELLEAPDHPTP